MFNKALIFFALICAFTSVGGTAHAAAPSPAPEFPDVHAQGAILMDYKTGRVLWEKNGDKPLPMASTTKIMTALIALESGKSEEIVTISRKASLAPEVKMFLKEGEKIKLKYLLYALMLESSNDAAVAIAEHISGSQEAFCAAMTERAKAFGATDTLFETPNGLDKGNHHSTAHDMALIAKHALEREDFVTLINTQSVTFNSDKRAYSMVNHNRLLAEYNGANGIKTGFTVKSGHCFVGAAKRGDMQLISVVLASGWGDKGKKQKWIDTKAILNYGFGNYKYAPLIDKGTAAGKTDVLRSKTGSVSLLYKDGLELPLTESERGNIKVNVNIPPSVKAPVNAGDVIGVADIMIGEQIIGRVDLISADSAVRHDLKTSMEKVISNWLKLCTDANPAVSLPEF